MKLLNTIITGSLLYTGAYADNVFKCKETIPNGVEQILKNKIKSGDTFGTYAGNKGTISYSIKKDKISGTYAGPNGAGIINCKVKKN